MTTYLLLLGVFFVIGFLWHFVKALKDPDVQKASELGMSITRYHKYQRLYDEYQEFMKVHGTDSNESIEKFKEIWGQIDNPNEWRRYSDYRLKEGSIERYCENYLKSK